jgi:erythromycin esterase-like protein
MGRACRHAAVLLLLAGAALAARPAPAAVEQLRGRVTPLGTEAAYERVVRLAGASRFVLLGEETHGTREFYRERAAITQRLVEAPGPDAVVLEADWPLMARVDRYVQGESGDASAAAALGGFVRFPRWMWRNAEFAEFVEWARRHNAASAPGDRVRLFGMDFYSLDESAGQVVADLRAAGMSTLQAEARYRCFDPFRRSPDLYAEYARQTRRGCEHQAEAQLIDLQRLVKRQQAGRGAVEPALFSAYENARVVKNAEYFYRVGAASVRMAWNVRDRHMVDTIDDVAEYLDPRPERVVVWAHNTHLGDARATEMAGRRQWSVGELMRRRHGGGAVLIGFSTYSGTVFAALARDGEGAARELRPAIASSTARLFHDVAVPAFVLGFRDDPAAAAVFARPMWQRDVGVVYQAHVERDSHYGKATLSKQFDAIVHVDRTAAVTPLP